MSPKIVVSPAPSRGGVIVRDAHTRAEVFIPRDEIVPVTVRMLDEHDRENDRRLS